MTEQERFKILANEHIDKEVYLYLKNMFDELNIEIMGRYNGILFDLMRSGRLEGWCWQTTETASLFMPNNSVIYRGNLFFNEYKKYYHSFIQFEYDHELYVFDPCLCLINTANLYFKILDVEVKASITAKEIKTYFMEYISNPPKKERHYSAETEAAADRFMRKFFGDDYAANKEKEVVIYGNDDPTTPMYRNNSGYKNVVIENKDVKSLTVHYYMNA